MLFELATSRSLVDIDSRLRASAARYLFGVTALHDLKSIMEKKGVNLAMDCLVYEVCNPQQAKIALEANGAVSTALPCRISVYGSDGDYRVATIRPKELMKLFGN